MAIGLGTDNNIIPVRFRTDSDGVKYPYVVDVKINQQIDSSINRASAFPIRTYCSSFGVRDYVETYNKLKYCPVAVLQKKATSLNISNIGASVSFTSGYPFIKVFPTTVTPFNIQYPSSPVCTTGDASSSPATGIKASFLRCDKWKLDYVTSSSWNVYGWMILAVENYNSVTKMNYTCGRYTGNQWGYTTDASTTSWKCYELGTTTFNNRSWTYILVKGQYDGSSSMQAISGKPAIITAPSVVVSCDATGYNLGESAVCILAWGVDAKIVNWIAT